jgi:hypothetical protein
MHTIDSKQIHDGGQISVGNLTLRFRLERDGCTEAPWVTDCTHGPVSDWTTRDKEPGERLLHSDRRSSRFYDYAGAMAMAKRDGWGLAPDALAELARKLGKAPTAGQIRESSVDADFEHLRGWCADEWFYSIVAVKLLDEDDCELASDYLGGVESCGDYWRECAAEMADRLLTEHAEESAERESWACRDSVTA